MEVNQAIFTSTRSRKSQGYHVVAISSGVDQELLRQLHVWGPSHASLLSDETNAESLNFHPLSDKRYAVSRTVYGGPEYSGRGGFQVFTRYLILHEDQLQGYAFNALEFAYTALALGALRLTMSLPDRLSTVDLPEKPLARVALPRGESPVPMDEVGRILLLGSRVAILGLEKPLPVLALLMRDVPEQERLSLSFCTGLRPSLDREFRVQFAHEPDSNVYKQYASQGVDYVTAS